MAPPPNRHLLLVLFFFLSLLRPAPMGSVAADREEGAGALLVLLQRVQSEALRVLGPLDFDPKLYVDLPLAPGASRAAAEAALASVRTREEMETFLARYFAAAGSDLLAADPPDFDPDPRGFLPRVGSGVARAWALEVHALWKDLARRVAPAVAARPDRHTLLLLPGRVVVPGSRFREVYYWDSYWVVRSVLLHLFFLPCVYVDLRRPGPDPPLLVASSYLLVTNVGKQ